MTNIGPLVSVVIPAYKVSEYIAETLTSVFQQTFQNFEVIVVNDCCPDSERLELALEPFLSRIRYMKTEKNGGPSAARNMGIRASRGEFVAFLDGDDLWVPNYLEVQTGMLRDDPDACLVYGNVRTVGSIFHGTLSQDFSPSTGPVTVSSILRQTVCVTLLNLARKRALLDAELFDVNIRCAEDFDMWVRIALGGGKIIYHSQVIAGYRRRDGSASTNPRNMLEGRLYTLNKLEHDPRLSAGDRILVKELANRWTAEAELEFSKQAFLAGADKDAVKHLSKANAYFKKARLRLIALLMAHVPGLLRLSMRLRLQTLGY